MQCMSDASPGGRHTTMYKREDAHPLDAVAQAYDPSMWEVEAKD